MSVKYVVERHNVVSHATKNPDWLETALPDAAWAAFHVDPAASAALLMGAARQTLKRAARFVAAALLANGESDALAEEELSTAAIVEDREPCEAVAQRLLDLLVDDVASLGLAAGAHGVGDTVVDDARSGHGDSPSVGRSEGGSSAVVGAAALDTSSAGVPTVGVPTDALAEPSAAGASVVPCLLREIEEQRAQLRADLYAMTRSAGGLHVDEIAQRLLEAGWRR